MFQFTKKAGQRKYNFALFTLTFLSILCFHGDVTGAQYIWSIAGLGAGFGYFNMQEHKITGVISED